MIPYIINVAIVLGGCLAFYKILLRKETFYRVNRYVLIICLLISFSLPLLPVPQQWSFRKKETGSSAIVQKPTLIGTDQLEQNTNSKQSTVNSTQPTVKSQQPATNPQSPIGNPQSASTKFSFSQLLTWAIWLYWFGVIVFAFNFLLQMVILIWKAYRNPVIIDGRYRIVEISGDKAPCSFGNTIFINPEKYEWDTYSQIIMHEKVHIRQKHTIDILFAELVLIFQWFNPFAWIYRREIESNLEFLTDDQLMQKEKVEKQSYQLSLLKVSAPHFPLSLTTNYNQSILKKRIAMMNAKRSNLHTAWKYFFLLPVLALFACLLNEPVARAQSNDNSKNEKKIKSHDISTEGYWFAVIKDDKINIRFSDDKEMDQSFDLNSGHSFSATTFKLSDLSSVPRGAEGNFTITREAGRMDFTGKFETNTGMGRYKFVADPAFVNYMNTELKEKLEEDDQMAFFFIDVKKAYLQMLRSEGYTSVTKDELIPLAALRIDQAYIKSIKDNGFKDVSLDDLVPLKALNVDAAYIKEIREAGYKNISTDQLVTFKAQGIDKDYISKVKQIKGKDGKIDEDDDGDDVVTYKSLNITDDFVNSFKAVGFTDLRRDQVVSLKAMNVSPAFIKGFLDAGVKNLDIDDVIAFKSLGVTPDFIKNFESMGYKNLTADNLTSMKALNITPDFIKSFEAIGYKNIDFDDLSGLKALGVTPDFVKGFEAIGYKDIPLEDLTSLKAVGVTPAYVTEMKSKGFNYDRLQKYVTLKSID